MALIDTQELRNVTANGLWKQNSTLVQILGMCPVLAITTTMVNGAMISFATLLVMASGNRLSPCCATTFPTKSVSRFSF